MGYDGELSFSNRKVYIYCLRFVIFPEDRKLYPKVGHVWRNGKCYRKGVGRLVRR